MRRFVLLGMWLVVACEEGGGSQAEPDASVDDAGPQGVTHDAAPNPDAGPTCLDKQRELIGVLNTDRPMIELRACERDDDCGFYRPAISCLDTREAFCPQAANKLNLEAAATRAATVGEAVCSDIPAFCAVNGGCENAQAVCRESRCVVVDPPTWTLPTPDAGS